MHASWPKERIYLYFCTVKLPWNLYIINSKWNGNINNEKKE